jgi:F-type H+-transporting ATPase subunit epsilon
LQIRIITPLDILLEQEVTLVTMPGEEGEFGVLPLHAPLIASLKPGLVKISNVDQNLKYFVWGGIARVTGGDVDIITEFAINVASTDKDITLEKISNLRDSLDHEDQIVRQEQLKEELLKFETLFNYL